MAVHLERLVEGGIDAYGQDLAVAGISKFFTQDHELITRHPGTRAGSALTVAGRRRSGPSCPSTSCSGKVNTAPRPEVTAAGPNCRLAGGGEVVRRGARGDQGDARSADVQDVDDPVHQTDDHGLDLEVGQHRAGEVAEDRRQGVLSSHGCPCQSWVGNGDTWTKTAVRRRVARTSSGSQASFSTIRSSSTRSTSLTGSPRFVHVTRAGSLPCCTARRIRLVRSMAPHC